MASGQWIGGGGEGREGRAVWERRDSLSKWLANKCLIAFCLPFYGRVPFIPVYAHSIYKFDVTMLILMRARWWVMKCGMPVAFRVQHTYKVGWPLWPLASFIPSNCTVALMHGHYPHAWLSAGSLALSAHCFQLAALTWEQAGRSWLSNQAEPVVAFPCLAFGLHF